MAGVTPYPIPIPALAGGANAVPGLYDAGTATVTITNTSVSPAVNYTTKSVSWGQGDTVGTVAAHLASAINTAAGSVVTATADGDTVSLAATPAGAGIAYTVATSIADTQTATYPTLFSSPSFSADSIDLTVGQPAESSDGTDLPQPGSDGRLRAERRPAPARRFRSWAPGASATTR